MTMKLTLAVTLECLPEECRVQLLESDTPITVHYSTRVKANPSLKIRPGQLVALNTATDNPGSSLSLALFQSRAIERR